MEPEVANGRQSQDQDEDQGQEQEEDPTPAELMQDQTPDVIDLVQSRIRDMKEIPKTDAVEYMYLRWNLLTKIEDLNACPNLRCLELYDNQISKIENLDALTKLEVLDISVNRLTKIEGLEKLENLQKLYLCSNKIQKIENLSHLKKLEELELGDNKIREIANLSGLDSLKRLYLGKNKIDKIKNLDDLKSLDLLSLQSNRITKIENLENLPQLTELHISENGILQIEGLEKLVNLTILDLASNRITLIQNVGHLSKLEELWLDTNKISDWTTVENLAALKNLNTVYLEHNPISQTSSYRRKVRLILPWLDNLDAIRVRLGSGSLFKGERSRSNITLKQSKSGASLSKSSRKGSSKSAAAQKEVSGSSRSKSDTTVQSVQRGRKDTPKSKSSDLKNSDLNPNATKNHKDKTKASVAAARNFYNVRSSKKPDAHKIDRGKSKTGAKYKMEQDRLRREESKTDQLKTNPKKDFACDRLKLKSLNGLIEQATLKLAQSNSCSITQSGRKLVKSDDPRVRNDAMGQKANSSHSDYRKLTANDYQHELSSIHAAKRDTATYKGYYSHLSTSETKLVRKDEGRIAGASKGTVRQTGARPRFCTSFVVSRSSRSRTNSLRIGCKLQSNFSVPHRKPAGVIDKANTKRVVEDDGATAASRDGQCSGRNTARENKTGQSFDSKPGSSQRFRKKSR